MGRFERLDVKPVLAPMEARAVPSLPKGPAWQFEPKWDGFRCLAFRDGESIELQSKAGRPLGRYFPDIERALLAIAVERFVIDGELVVPIGGALSFEALQLRLHPAESRVRKLSAEAPAKLILFDLLENEVANLSAAPLDRRREALEAFHAAHGGPDLLLSPFTHDGGVAEQWLARAGDALDGVIAKRRDWPYRAGERAMLKVKRLRTADCVVGGFRYASKAREVGSLLLGLYDEAGRLNHVGFTSSIPSAERKALTRKLEALIEPPGFTGDAPGGPSRWSSERSADWQPLRPELVAEVRFDHVTGRRFRHGTKFLRWRPDKAPRQCRMDQLSPEAAPDLLAPVLAKR